MRKSPAEFPGATARSCLWDILTKLLSRENSFSPVLPLENPSWCHGRVCPSPVGFCRVGGPQFSPDEAGGRKMMWNSAFPKDGAVALLGQARHCPAGPWASSWAPQQPWVPTFSARNLPISKLPGFRSSPAKRQTRARPSGPLGWVSWNSDLFRQEGKHPLSLFVQCQHKIKTN